MVTASPNSQRHTYSYDGIGTRRSLSGTRTTYGYDSANQLRYGQAVAGRTTFQYDLTGNQRIKQPPTGNRTTTTWNYENQPTQYLLPTGSPVTMAYNGDNRRISLQQGTTTTKFVWDSVIDAYVKELDGSNIVQAVYTSEPQHYGAVLSQRRGSTSHVLHADALGTIRLLTTSAGASSDTYLYDAWGNLITSSGTTVNPFRWVGRYGYYMDQNTGMVYVRARMYLPTVARWASVDPVLLFSLRTPFVYVENRTVWLTDPSGLFWGDYPWWLPDPSIYTRPPYVVINGDEVRPKVPEDWPTPDPSLDTNCFIAQCDTFTVAEWGEDLCNFEKRPGDPPCPCHTMKDAGQPLTDDEIKQLFEDARSRIAMLNVKGLCKVELAIRNKCSATPGFKHFAVTCPGESGKNPKICFPRTITKCEAPALMEHEMLHALQACQGRHKKQPIGVLEEEAYRINCTAKEIRDCTPPGPLRERRIRACIAEGERGSTGGSGGGAFNEICRELQENGGAR